MLPTRAHTWILTIKIRKAPLKNFPWPKWNLENIIMRILSYHERQLQPGWKTLSVFSIVVNDAFQKCFLLANASKWFFFRIIFHLWYQHIKTIKKHEKKINLMFFQVKCTFETRLNTVLNAKTNSVHPLVIYPMILDFMVLIKMWSNQHTIIIT